jgi:hypothetical protein
MLRVHEIDLLNAPPTAKELLAKYAQALKSVSSLISKSECTAEHSWAYSRDWHEPQYRGRRHQGTTYERLETRTDGTRLHQRSYKWGQISDTFPSVSEDAPVYNCRNYAEGELYRHSMTVNPDGQGGLVMRSKTRSYTTGGIERRLEGYHVQSNERVDSVLSKAKHISVRPRTEKVGGSDCYVIDAETEVGKVSVWIDPAHGHHLARAEAKGTEGDLYFGKPLGKGQVISNSIEIRRFDDVNGVWVPMEVVATMENRYGPGSYSKARRLYKRVEILLNPDHDALGSFDSPIQNPRNDPLLVNGTMVKRAGEKGAFIWQDGKLMPSKK